MKAKWEFYFISRCICLKCCFFCHRLTTSPKFGIDVPYEKIMIFRKAAEQHVAARPREWLAFLGFRSGAISVDLGFITYTIIVQHREPWQNVRSILESKGALTAYCLEVAKQLDMRYRSPPLPVDLNVLNNGVLQNSEDRLKN